MPWGTKYKEKRTRKWFWLNLAKRYWVCALDQIQINAKQVKKATATSGASASFNIILCFEKSQNHRITVSHRMQHFMSWHGHLPFALHLKANNARLWAMAMAISLWEIHWYTSNNITSAWGLGFPTVQDEIQWLRQCWCSLSQTLMSSYSGHQKKGAESGPGENNIKQECMRNDNDTSVTVPVWGVWGLGFPTVQDEIQWLRWCWCSPPQTLMSSYSGHQKKGAESGPGENNIKQEFRMHEKWQWHFSHSASLESGAWGSQLSKMKSNDCDDVDVLRLKP